MQCALVVVAVLFVANDASNENEENGCPTATAVNKKSYITKQ